jgi:hypothetical protein
MATQRTQIYLEGVSVDLDKNIDTDLTYSIADIGDFETRKTTYSKTVSIPATANNNFLFGNYFDANIENPYDSLVENVGVNFNPLKKAFVQVLVDNVEVFAGVLRLLEIKQLEDGSIVYECALFGSLGGLFTAVGDKMLTDLDWSAYSAPFNFYDIVASWSRTDWIYTMANYGLVTTTTPSEWSFKINSFRPSFFLKTIYNKILEEAGYTSNDFFINNLEKLLFINGDENYSIYVTNLATGNFSAGQTITELAIDGPLAINISGGYLAGNNLYIFNDTQSPLDVNVSGTIDYRLNSSSVLPRIVKFGVYNGLTTLIAEHSHTMTSLGNGSFSYNFNIQIPTDTNSISFQFRFPDGGFFSFNRFSTSTFSLISNNKSLKAPIKQGIGSIEGKNFVPDGMKQSDFLKALFNLFNLYITTNPENEFDLVVKPYPNFYTTNEVDWTYKVDNNKGFSIKPSNQYLPKSFVYKYKDDTDYYSKVYKNKYGVSFGSYIKATDNEFSKDDKTIEIPFSLPITARFGLNSDMYLPAMYDLEANGDYKQVQTNPKLAFFGGIKSCSNYKIVNINGSANSNDNLTYPYFGHLYDFETNGNEESNLFDVAFNKPQDIYYPQLVDYPQNNLYKFYYEGYVYNLNSKDSKLVGLYLLLNNLDIKNIDFTKLVRVGTTLYYLNLVDGYNPLSNELTKVELLKYNPLIIEEV